MSYLECPYCEHDCGDYFDDCHESNVEYEHECEECGKNFIFTIEYDPTFSGFKADCLNGGEHEYEPICGVPKEAFENRYRCKNCSKEIRKESSDNSEKGNTQ